MGGRQQPHPEVIVIVSADSVKEVDTCADDCHTKDSNRSREPGWKGQMRRTRGGMDE